MKAEEHGVKPKGGADLQVVDLLYQSLEAEMGGVEIYRLALLCARSAELKEEWTKYLAQSARRLHVLRDVFDDLGLDPEITTPGRQIVRDNAKVLLSALHKVLKDAPRTGEIVGRECALEADTKDHAKADTVADKHLHHTKGLCREVWRRDSLGLDAQLLPEEPGNLKSAGAAARAAR